MNPIKSNEFEVIQYPKIHNINAFIVAMIYRSPHLHKDFELIYTLEGQLTLICNGERHTGLPGDMLLVNPNSPHEFYTHGAVGATFLCLQISPRFFRDAFPVMQDVSFESIKLPPREHDKWCADMRNCCIRLSTAYMDSDSQNRLLCASECNQLFHLLLKHVPHSFLTAAEQQAVSWKAERILRLIDFVENNFMHKINLKDFADAEGISLNHMSYFVKKNLNHNFQEYVTDIRFNHARKLLTLGNKRLIDVCLESGFSDARYLTKAFSKKVGMSPDAYRRKFSAQEETARHWSPHSAEMIYSDEESRRILKYVSTLH